MSFKNARKPNLNATHNTYQNSYIYWHKCVKKRYIGPKHQLGIYITDIETKNILKFQNGIIKLVCYEIYSNEILKLHIHKKFEAKFTNCLVL
jgi:hypothetical protein